MLRLFQAISGLKVNFDKSLIYHPNNDIEKLGSWAIVLGCNIGRIPFKYLGAWVGKNPSSAGFWDSLLVSVKNKISGWKLSSLNFPGRMTLLQACLDGIPTYWFGLHKIPAGVIHRLECFRRKFLWGEFKDASVEKRKLHLLNWNSVCTPKTGGGLGLQRIKERNVAFLGKWWWKFQTERNKKWHRLIRENYNVRVSLSEIQGKKISPIIKDVLSIQASPLFGSMFDMSCWQWKARNGANLFFWHDN